MKNIITQNEIRVGNILYFPFHKQNVSIVGYAKIERDDSFKVQFETNGGILLEPLSVLRPIQITEEILLKCGFEKWNATVNMGYSGQFHRGWVIGDFNINQTYYGLTAANIKKNDNVIIEYLHQLQNIYYFLSEKELAINL
jgi:hypothetical protein